jgi:hypothetical protein
METRRIIYKRGDGGVSIIIPAGNVEQAIKDIPEGCPYKIVDISQLKVDRTFRNQWTMDVDNNIVVDIKKAKEYAHKIRREKRDKEFEPFDNIIMKQIPGNDYTEAEANRASVRAKYVDIQDRIDVSNTEEELLSVFKEI